ncbi:Tenascin,Fibrinogen-like protein A,Angiopoietin-4,Ryncolin-2,Fibrinogen C domain-containing protein 1-A,Techylectin-5B,Microfibril-associated glycoprotein 4,Tenascin-N,Ficolin-2,Ryncolin-1,Tenascin-R,Ryncolin-3,Ficolin-1,Fibrinogen C domain-containing protein 1-B,Fibrinogen C domain-containing protein 1 [Mytilus coruscus]|uniref:Fibrinogen C-terminal domain-containing protein n=1 Tax=Mytilus coruscus TaxID=42192 RepID=A0A6J8C3D6_MYTCO|nr:Tenascin,Fibrinogen-like protein A,Angiopoietin-4,Ryncolin-2,Fibrinogen C domain-containing protein 1-A,Techylectin-5B,Microfibril-associated glycoprotein 4,Tenascin-N,Ficolin-2,Ryncolin-1,Tenascin-R,Ryncolin-3,Ficolin-1,Fibrinogen C domain-containing protein 1-B,Fibrinogen C domain-containing protein 1 [Mytilus coruscus]
MEYCWKLNSMSIVVALSFSLYGDLSVTALGSDTKDIGNEDQLSIPLINDKGAPLVAMLDTNAINRKMKVYIRTLMREMIQSSMQEQMQGIFKTSLEKNSTIDFIRNITLQEINEVLKEQGQEGISSPPIEKYKDCSELKRKTKQILNDGVYSIYPGGDDPVQAYCDMTTDGGGWTVIHKRHGRNVNFQRKWLECENGFGDINGQFWFGNKYTHILTSSGKYELRVDLVDSSGDKKYALYKTFSIGDARSKYKLTVDNFSGTAANQLRYHNGMKFTTLDQDNDTHGKNCALLRGGSWWYYACTGCDLTSSGNFKPFWGSINPAAQSVMMIRKT